MANRVSYRILMFLACASYKIIISLTGRAFYWISRHELIKSEALQDSPSPPLFAAGRMLFVATVAGRKLDSPQEPDRGQLVTAVRDRTKVIIAVSIHGDATRVSR